MTGSQEVLGSRSTVNEKNERTTYVTWKGLEASRAEVERLSKEAVEELRGTQTGRSVFGGITFVIDPPRKIGEERTKGDGCMVLEKIQKENDIKETEAGRTEASGG